MLATTWHAREADEVGVNRIVQVGHSSLPLARGHSLGRIQLKAKVDIVA